MNLMVNGSDGDDSLKALRGKQNEGMRGNVDFSRALFPSNWEEHGEPWLSA